MEDRRRGINSHKIGKVPPHDKRNGNKAHLQWDFYRPKRKQPSYCCKKAGLLKVYWVLCFMHPKVWLMATSCMELQKITLIFNIMRTKHVILFESVWLFPNSDLWFCLGTELCAIVPDGWLANGVWAVVGFTLLWATSHCGMLCFQLIVFVFLVLL